MSTAMPPVPPPPPAAAAKAAGASKPAQNVLPEPQVQQDDVPVQAKPSMWDNPNMAGIAGLATSILIHASVIIIAAVLFYNKEEIVRLISAEQQIIPTAELATDTPGGIPNPGMNADSTRAAAQNVDSSVTQSENWAETKSDNLDKTLSSGAAGDSAPTVISSYGGATSGGTTGMNSGGAGGGKLAKFGAPGGGQGMGPKGPVFGNGGNVTKMVFIVDATGSMNDRWQVLVRELQSTITKLKPVQSFNVVLFRDGAYVVMDKGGLVPATDVNKKRSDDFLKQYGPSGKTIPFEAIDTALKMKPELAYVLVDPFIFDTMTSTDPVKDFTEALRKGKGSQNMKINFIMFHARSADKNKPALTTVKNTLEGLAKEFGGKLANVSMEDLFANR